MNEQNKETAKSYRFDTRCICGDRAAAHPYGAVAMPIFQTAMYSHPGIGQSTGFDYSRESNPTRSCLEEVIRDLDGAYDSIACASGMAAISLCMTLFLPGDHLVCSRDLYGGSVRLFDQLEKMGLQFSYTDTSDLEKTEALIRPETKALFIETPSNPTMRITDLRAIRALADKHGLLVIADNTFLSPYFQRPLELGADIAIQSATKFLCGHNDVIAGVVSVRSAELSQKLRFNYKTDGGCLSAFDSYLLLRGIKTLALRQDRQQANAIRIAAWLKTCPKVKDVYYPGLPDHPGYEVQKSQASGFGSMISFHTDSAETARGLLEHIQLILYAESLGGVETLLTYPMLQTHGDVPKEIRDELGITDTFLRMSVGIENADDLIADLEQAFAKL